MSRKNRFSIRKILLVTAAVIAICVAVDFITTRKETRHPEQTASVAQDTSKHPKTVFDDGHWKAVTIPAGIPSELIDYEGFSVSFNKKNGTPNYSCWELLGEETTGKEARSQKFMRDENVDGCPEYFDYSNSGYDRGHLCPAADQKWSNRAMTDCFFMTNICPQKHQLNAGAWNTLENKCRSWAQRDSALWIIAGPIYRPQDKKFIGKETKVRVPSSFFKVIVAPFLPEPRGIAFVYPNQQAPGNMKDYSMSIDQLEEITGYDFFSSLPREEQEKFEKTASFNDWVN